MPSFLIPVHASELPPGALLRRYLDSGAYVDCYIAKIGRPVAHAEFVEAFYTTSVFKLERLVLTWLVARPSTDAQVRALASGESTSFAAWNVEARAPNQVLLCDFQGRTRSWLMCAPGTNSGSTQLFFGSAVVPVSDKPTGHRRMGLAFRAMLGFHELYSRVLLRAAVHRLVRGGVS